MILFSISPMILWLQCNQHLLGHSFESNLRILHSCLLGLWWCNSMFWHGFLRTFFWNYWYKQLVGTSHVLTFSAFCSIFSGSRLLATSLSLNFCCVLLFKELLLDILVFVVAIICKFNPWSDKVLLDWSGGKTIFQNWCRMTSLLIWPKYFAPCFIVLTKVQHSFLA